MDRAKDRFLVQYGNFMEFKEVAEISHFYAEEKGVYLVDVHRNKFILNESLQKIQEKLSDTEFFRANRKYLVHIKDIRRIRRLPNRTLSLQLNTASTELICVARGRVKEFKDWLSSF